MAKVHLHPYRPPEEIAGTVDRLHKEPSPIVHPQRVLESMRKERPQISQINGWLADHIVGLVGTMAFFYFLCLVLGAWTIWQSAIEHGNGFDPFPYAFLFLSWAGSCSRYLFRLCLRLPTERLTRPGQGRGRPPRLVAPIQGERGAAFSPAPASRTRAWQINRVNITGRALAAAWPIVARKRLRLHREWACRPPPAAAGRG